jgi:nucleoid DNA-binding protein
MDPSVVEEIVGFLLTCEPATWLRFPGVGWLTVKEYKAYRGRDPQTGDPVVAPGPKWMPFFIVDGALKDELNGRPPRSADPDAEPMKEVQVRAVDALARQLRATLLAGENVAIAGLGTFELFVKPGRPGVNPDTGESITIPPFTGARLKASTELKQRLATRR